MTGAQAARAEGLRTGARLMGARGLNVVPDARMDAPGTLRAGVALSDPYLHITAGAQLAEPLSVTLRQSARVSSLTDQPRALSPALDLKLRLIPESAHLPAIAVGADGLFGARALASEYIVASKRYGDFDATLGVGWGRMGRGGPFGNPFGFLDRARDVDEARVNGPGDWLSGRTFAPFAGVAWVPSFAPDVSLKADWVGADLWATERAADPGFDAPGRWSAALSWRIAPGLELGLGTLGARSLMASLNLSGMPERWRVSAPKSPLAAQGPRMPPRLYDVSSGAVGGKGHPNMTAGRLRLDLERPPGSQIGRALRDMARAAGPQTDLLQISLESEGTRGPSVRLPMAEVRALEGGRASPEELWRSARFGPPSPRTRNTPARLAGRFRWILQTDVSLAERSMALAHRTGLAVEGDMHLSNLPGFHLGGRVRAHLFGNAHTLPVRATEPKKGQGRAAFADFAGLSLMPESLYARANTTLAPGLHASAAAGYLEEMYAGAGGEVLWRPFEGRLALGADAWAAVQRDPGTIGALGLEDGGHLTGHLNAWYEWPENDLTFYARAGRYLAGDVGGTLGAVRSWRNGVQLDTSVTVTDGANRDALGQSEPMGLARMALRVPLGFLSGPYVPQGGQVRLTFAPMGRRAGQALDNPAPLYDLTRHFSAGQLARDWSTLSD